jgi:hypothetical protein
VSDRPTVGTEYFPCTPEQRVRVEGRIRNEWGDLVWRPGDLHGWSLRDGAWAAHVVFAPRADVEYAVRLPPDRVRGASPP